MIENREGMKLILYVSQYIKTREITENYQKFFEKSLEDL